MNRWRQDFGLWEQELAYEIRKDMTMIMIDDVDKLPRPGLGEVPKSQKERTGK